MNRETNNIYVANLSEGQNLENDSPLLKYLLRKASENGDSDLAVNFTDVVEITIKKGDEIKEVIRL